ncbi:twin-arginine translocase TatA/TatE family subunit [Neptunicella sp. SCSIO 80796]|uniref:twin-arginine translocase TatA/TatE family subunit n=1 Tax=Neptunicella plasticusilytica TaxID=3117012 RepID=UPI003A4D318F
MGLSIWQIVLVVMLFLLLFGRGKIPALMTDLAEGIKGFKKGINDVDEPQQQSPQPSIEKKGDKESPEHSTS